MKEVLEDLENNMNLSNSAFYRDKGQRIKEILTKAQNRRSPEEVDELIGIITDIKFFQERKEIKPSNFRDLVTAF